MRLAPTFRKLAAMSSCPLRRITSQAKILKTRMKDDKEDFGPLLETAKERNKRRKSAKPPPTPQPPKANQIEAELSWTIGSTNTKNLRYFIGNDKVRADEKSSLRKFQSLNLSELPEFPDSSNSITKMTTIGSSKSGRIEDFPPSTARIDKKVQNIVKNIQGNDKSSCGSDIEDSLDSSRNDASYFPITNPEKARDEWGNAGIVSLGPGERKNIYLPGVTRILNQTMSEEGKLMLEKWRKKMILQLGEEGFAKYSKKLLDDSKIMHSLVEKSLKKEELPEVPEDLRPSFGSLKLVLKELSGVRMLESHVVHPSLGYRGIVDCVASYRGNLCIIDWKKSEKIKDLSATYDSPLQVSAYIGALNADPNYPFQVKAGLLAIAYTQGQPPSVFEFSAAKLDFYWREWLKRLEKYKSTRKAKL